MKSKSGRYGIEGLLLRSWIYPGYWKTLACLSRADRSQVVVDGSALRLINYPFEPATVFPTGTVSLNQIAEVNLGFPSTVRLKSGEILFISQPNKEALMAFLNQTDVKIERRSSIWSALLTPFLDTWEEQETIDAQFAWFANLGLDRNAVDHWRREVAVAMIAYNFGTCLWEWAHLDFYDALMAQRARLSRTKFADFYSRAMHLAQIDPVLPSQDLSFANTVESALFAVLIDWYPHEEGSFKDFSKEFRVRTDHVEQLRQKLSAELTSAYSEAHRRYHTLTHIEHCLKELGHVSLYAIHLNEIRWAILFHDAIYDPQRQDNEARSAEWACKVMEELHRPSEEQGRVRAMILSTAHAGEPRTPDEALLLDIDLSILGANEAAFDEYDQSIRAEYEWVPENSYRQARAKMLESFFTRRQLYYTALYRQRYETSARKNIQRALTRLRSLDT